MVSQHMEVSGDSGAYQAGRDIIKSGLSVAEAIEIAEYLFRKNFVELREEAAKLAALRAEELIREVVQRISSSGKSLDHFGDPDMQYLLLAAQRDYARMGGCELKDVLVSLLISRCSEGSGKFENIVLGEAIETARKLTAAQVNILTVCWLFTSAKHGEPVVIADLVNAWDKVLRPVVLKLPMHDSEYRHLEYIGCATRKFFLQMSNPADLLIKVYPGLFQSGLHSNEIRDYLTASSFDPPLFVKCANDANLFQVNAVTFGEVRDLAKVHIPENASGFVDLFKRNVMGAEAASVLLESVIPWWSHLVNVWMNTSLGKLQLTSVGTAIAHNYWNSMRSHLPVGKA